MIMDVELGCGHHIECDDQAEELPLPGDEAECPECEEYEVVTLVCPAEGEEAED